MRVKMLKTRNYTPAEDRRVTVKYLIGGEYTVRRSWGEDMVAAGEAKEIKAPPRNKEESISA